MSQQSSRESIVNGEVDFSDNIFTLKQHGDTVSHIRNNLKMNSFGTNLQSTGIVAIPGEVFNIYVEAEDGKRERESVILEMFWQLQLADENYW